MKIPVGYLSQWDSTASLSKNDCGATSVAMVLNYYGTTCTSDEVFKKTGAGQGYISFEQLQKACNDYGFKTEVSYTNDLKQYIDKGIPPVTVVHYGLIPNRQDTFTGAHIFTVVGYDDNGYFVNDPNYWSPRREEGHNKFIPFKDFDKARNANTLDGNRTDVNLIIFPKETMKPSSKLPDVFYTIAEFVKAQKLWKESPSKTDAFDTIIDKANKSVEYEQKHFDSELESVNQKNTTDRNKLIEDHQTEVNGLQTIINEKNDEIARLTSEPKPKTEASAEVLRLTFFGVISYLTTEVGISNLLAPFGTHLDAQTKASLSILLLGLFRWLDKYLHEKSKTEDIKFAGLTPQSILDAFKKN